MRVTLQIPDELYDAYAAHLQPPLNGHASPEDLMISQLERFKTVSPQDRAVIVANRDRIRLEEILSGGTLRDSADLVKKVEGLARLEIGEVKVTFTPGELNNIKVFAAKNRIPVQRAVEQVVHGMKEQFGLYVG